MTPTSRGTGWSRSTARQATAHASGVSVPLSTGATSFARNAARRFPRDSRIGNVIVPYGTCGAAAATAPHRAGASGTTAGAGPAGPASTMETLRPAARPLTQPSSRRRRGGRPAGTLGLAGRAPGSPAPDSRVEVRRCLKSRASIFVELDVQLHVDGVVVGV